jgi:RNA recognition motif-containing protein
MNQSANKKLYVGSLPYSITEDELRELFSPFGTVESARIITDKFTGQSKGFGFVEMASNEDALKAIEGLKNKQLNGRTLIVNEARPQEPRTGGAGGGGGAGRRERSFGGGNAGGGGDRWGEDRGPRRPRRDQM